MNGPVELRPKTLNQLAAEGSLFFLSYRQAASASAIIVHIKVGNKPVSMTATLGSGLATIIALIEAASVTVDGTAQVLRNYNRNHLDDTLLTKVFTAPTYTGGTAIVISQSGFGTNNGSAQSGTSTQDIEYTLRRSTSYLYTFTPASATDINFRLFLTEADLF
jgi:hypothetical protein